MIFQEKFLVRGIVIEGDKIIVINEQKSAFMLSFHREEVGTFDSIVKGAHKG